MRVLVTGANGLVGQRVCATLARAGVQVTGTSLGPRRVIGAWAYESCDLTLNAEVSRVFHAVRPEAVVHCAAATDVDWCERHADAAYAANVTATIAVATESRRAEAHLVHVSTDYVFDGVAGPYSEEDHPSPHSIYAVTKNVSEERVRALAGSWAIARPSWVYGWPRARRDNFGSWLVSTLAKGEQARLFADQVASPTHAVSLASMLSELALKRLGGVWNTCGAEVVTRVAFGERVCAVFGFDPSLLVPVRLETAKLSAPRPLRGGLKADKAIASLAAKPQSLDVSVRALHEEWLATRDGATQ